MLMRIGAAVVRMDGIGGVGTEEAYRNRGYSRRLMEFALARMRAGDAALSTLYGIQDFYPKFGYVTTGPEHAVGLPLDGSAPATASLPPGWSVRPLAVGDLPALMALYHANTKQATGALVRHETGDELAETDQLARASPTARRIGMRAWNRLRQLVAEPGEDECRVVLDASGAIAAYAWYGVNNWWMFYRRQEVPSAFHLAEVMARDPTAAEAVLAVCRAWAAETGAITTWSRWRCRRRARSPGRRRTTMDASSASSPARATSWAGCSMSAASYSRWCPSLRPGSVPPACPFAGN